MDILDVQKNGFVFVISMLMFLTIIPQQGHGLIPTDPNIDLLLIAPAGDQLYAGYALFVKSSLSQIGIDVQIQFLSPLQFQGAITHQTSSRPFDLAIYQPTHDQIYPEFMWQYDSQPGAKGLGTQVYQLDNPEWQRWQEEDIGITTQNVDGLIEEIEYSTDFINRHELVRNFTQLFMENLLYDYPLTTTTEVNAGWLGYGDDNNEGTGTLDTTGEFHTKNDLWNVQEGEVESRKLGAVWNPLSTAQDRLDHANLTTLQLRATVPTLPNNFDPYEAFDQSTKLQSKYLSDHLLSYSYDGQFHPEIAYNFIATDWQNPETGETVSNGKYTFFINHDYQFSRTKIPLTKEEFIDVPQHNVDARDFTFTLDLLKFADTMNLPLNIPENFRHIHSWGVESTLETNDTLNIYFNNSSVNDLYFLSQLKPLPEHILNGSMTTVNGKEFMPLVDPIDPLSSVQWKYWSSKSGISLAGPYELVNYGPASFSMRARSDYPYPNEWDTKTKYDQNSSAFSEYLYQGYDLSYFAPHYYLTPPDAHYWSFKDKSSTTEHEKPTNQGITHLIFKIINDDIEARQLFENGELDFCEEITLGSSTVVSDWNEFYFYVIKSSIPVKSPYLLVFNLLNDHLKKINIRKAIANAIDQDEMTKINDGFAVRHDSPVWRVFDLYSPTEFKAAGPHGEDLSWYIFDYAISYNIPTAKGLLQGEGYSLPTNTNSTFPQPTTSTLIIDVTETQTQYITNEGILNFSYFSLIGALMVVITYPKFIRKEK